ncbi:hypothetical protein [Methylobacterium fujisawaense]
MEAEDIIWQTAKEGLIVQVRHPYPSGLHTARFDTLSEDGSHRLGNTVEIAYWPERAEYRFSGTQDTMTPLAFKCWLMDKCQVAFNEYGCF